MSQTSAIKSQRVVLPNEVRPATIVIEDGLIKSIEAYDFDTEAEDFGNLAILPGVIDPHVHFNDPGRAEWEGWKSGTMAAIAGGVTTVVDMPLNCIPSTVDLSSIWAKRVSTSSQLYCDVGFWGGAVPGNSDDLRALVGAGALGLKCFMSDPGTKEFSHLDLDELRLAMERIAEIDSVLLLHAESPSALKEPSPQVNPEAYRAWLETRPVEAERQAISDVIRLARETGCRCHVVHVATPEVLDLFEGSDVSCETCAHYLVFCAEEIEDRATNFKCAPPIRERIHQEGLWQALREGKISMVTSDHSPCPPDMKNASFLESWGGIAGVQMLLSAVWTGASKRGFQLTELSQWLSAKPADLAGLSETVGSITAGKLAHLIVFDPEAEYLCKELFHQHPGSPYEGLRWKGLVKATYLRGSKVYANGQILAKEGRLING
jgi:allantoinase